MSYDLMSVISTGTVVGEPKFPGEYGVAWTMNEALVCPTK